MGGNTTLAQPSCLQMYVFRFLGENCATKHITFLKNGRQIYNLRYGYVHRGIRVPNPLRF